MNERIEHLMYQAGLTAQGCWDKLDDYDRTAIEKFAELIVRECIQQLETGKKCDPYTGELFTCEHNDNIDYQIKVLKEHFELELPEKFQTHAHAIDMSEKHVHKSDKNEHEGWYGQWQWQCGYERGWDKAMEHKREWAGLSDEDIWQLRRDGAHEVSDKDFKAIEAKLKEKNT